jgi:protein SCO1/2
MKFMENGHMNTAWIRMMMALLALAATASAARADNRWGADYFPNVVLTTQTGAKVRFYDDLLKGKAVAIDLIYTRCQDVCPLQTARMAQLQKALGDRVGRDVFFYSISIDPEHDTPEVLREYASDYKVGPGWLFLTGKPEDIKLITRKLGLLRDNDAASRDGHTPSLMIGDEPSGQWMRNSAVDNPQFLASTMANFFGWKRQSPGKSYAEAKPLNMAKGEYLFVTRCGTCHTVGQGDRLGPDLEGVTTRRERAWLTRVVRTPDALLAEGDPVMKALFEKYNRVRMPNQGLAAEEVDAVLGYLEKKAAPARTAARADTN